MTSAEILFLDNFMKTFLYGLESSLGDHADFTLWKPLNAKAGDQMLPNKFCFCKANSSSVSSPASRIAFNLSTRCLNAANSASGSAEEGGTTGAVGVAAVGGEAGGA
jgi:hypothetical protein